MLSPAGRALIMAYIYIFTTEKSRSCHVRFYFLPLQIILARLNT